MEKEFIPYEQALALKELGFDEPCFGYYLDEKLNIFHSTSENDRINSKTIEIFSSDVITSPTFSQAFRFFREKYNYLNAVFPNIHQKNWNYHIQYYDVNEMWGECYMKGDFKTYEEAELECLKKLIEITIA